MKISDKIKANFYAQKPMRATHTEGVFAAAKRIRDDLALSISDEILAQCAYLHDFTKEMDTASQLEMLEKYGETLFDDDFGIPKVYHSRTAAIIGERIYALSSEVCDAVRYHTTGRAGMSTLEKIIYLADYIEENRTSADCLRVREKYNKKHKKADALDRLTLYALDVSLKTLIAEGKVIHPHTAEARNYLLKRGIKIWKK